MMKGFVISSEGRCLCEIDFVDETDVYRAMLTLRMMTSYAQKQDSKYYVSVEDALPVIFYVKDSDEEICSKTDFVLSKSNSLEDTLWFLKRGTRVYEGKRLSDCIVEEVYYGYNDELDSHGEIYKLKLDNGLVISIREVYKA